MKNFEFFPFLVFVASPALVGKLHLLYIHYPLLASILLLIVMVFSAIGVVTAYNWIFKKKK